MTDDADTICTVSFYGRLIDPPAAAMSECHFCVSWWDGSVVRRTYLGDRPGAEAYAQARHGLISRLFPDRPWPTEAEVKAAAVGDILPTHLRDVRPAP